MMRQISHQKYHHLVTIHSLYPNSTIHLSNAWGENDEAMYMLKNHRNPTLHSAITEARTESAIVTFNFFYSTIKMTTQNIPSIQNDAKRSSKLQVVEVVSVCHA
jgi:hypothetical protein